MAIIYLADLNITNSVGVPLTLYYSTGKTRTIGGISYVAKISQPAFLGQSISIDSSIGGAISSSIGELILTNSKRDLDYLKTYIFEGKTLIVYSYDTVSLVKTQILSQTIEQAAFEWTQISVRLENKSASLDVPIQTKKYLGTNVLPDGVEGVIDLKDKLKPILFGRVNNITPVLVNTSKLIYQISSEPIQQLVLVMTRGAYVSAADAVITNFTDFNSESNSALYPSGGYYTFYSGVEGSFFRLGMESDAVTCTVWEKSAALDNTPAKVIKRILNYAGVTSYLESDFTYLDTKIADNIGILIGDGETVSSALTTICSSIGAWWGFDQTNTFRLYYFGDVSGSVLADIHVKTDPDKYGITSFELANATINGKTDPVKEVGLEYAKNYTVQDKGSIAGIITTTALDRTTWLSKEYRNATASKDLTILYPKSQILNYPTLLNSEYGAIAEAQRVLNLTSVKRNVITITARMSLEELNALYPCGIVNIVMPRYGFTNGKKCIIIGMELDYLNYTANLTLWGDILDLQYMPTLDLDFLTMGEVLPSNVTYSRTGIGTRVNKSGYLETVAANNPRFDYHPIDGYCKGILVEDIRTNLLLNSTIDGANLVTQDITTTTATRTLSFYGTGTVILSGTKAATIDGLGAYPTRTTYTYTPTAGILSVTVSGTVQYANDEAGSFATSFIPTNGIRAARGFDRISTTDISWYKQTQGTFRVSFYNHYRGTSGTAYLFYMPGTVAGNTTSVYQSNTTTAIVCSCITNNTNQAGINLGLAAYDTPHTVVYSYYPNDMTGAKDGATPLTDTVATLPTLSSLFLGSQGSSGTVWNSHITNFTYYPIDIANNDIQNLSKVD